MSADGKCPSSSLDMLLNDPATLNVIEKPAADDNAERAMNWDLGNGNFLDSLLKMENLNDLAPFEFLSSNEDFMSSAATTPRSYDNADSSSCPDSGLSSVDYMSFNPISESSKSDDAVTKMDFTYDSSIQEEIIDDDEVVIDDDTTQENNEETNDNHILEENPTIIQQPQLLKTTPRTVVISPKRSKGPSTISKKLSKPGFIPINVSNIETIKEVNQNGKTINADAFRKLQSINNGRRIFVKNNDGSMVSKSMPALEETKIVMSACKSDESESMYPRLYLSNDERKLMEKGGIKLPSHYPLTKQEERDLKLIRRKIKNKIAARNSRKLKKEYVDDLKKRCKQYSDINIQLIKNVCTLQTEIEQLKAALKRLQNFILSRGGQESNTAVPGRSRNLLFSKSGSPLSTTNSKYILNMVANGSSADGQGDTIRAELGELLDFNNLARNKDHDYSGISMNDYYIPEPDDGWTKAEKRSTPPEGIYKLITPVVKSKLDTKRVVFMSSDEESY